MLDAAELAWGRWNGGSIAPIGSYWCLRDMAIFQQASDGNLPQAGTWCRVDSSATQTLANMATTINNLLGTAYTAASFHTYTTADNIASPGQMSDDA